MATHQGIRGIKLQLFCKAGTILGNSCEVMSWHTLDRLRVKMTPKILRRSRRPKKGGVHLLAWVTSALCTVVGLSPTHHDLSREMKLPLHERKQGSFLKCDCNPKMPQTSPSSPSGRRSHRKQKSSPYHWPWTGYCARTCWACGETETQSCKTEEPNDSGASSPMKQKLAGSGVFERQVKQSVSLFLWWGVCVCKCKGSLCGSYWPWIWSNPLASASPVLES